MTATPPTEPQRRQVEATVRQARRHWRRVGVPRAERHRRAEELRDHLDTVVDAGGRVADVVGDDPTAFASQWAQADRRHPLAGVLLQFVAALLLASGALALLGPWWFDTTTTGFTTRTVGFTTLVLAGAYAIHTVRTLRGKLTRPTLVLLAAVFPAAMAAGAAALAAFGDPQRFIAVHPTQGGALLAAGGLLALAEAWLRRTGRL